MDFLHTYSHHLKPKGMVMNENNFHINQQCLGHTNLIVSLTDVHATQGG
jgi:hypothetical protein